jgi:class 3 adenylate cyclase
MESAKAEVTRRYSKYIFLDVVSFSLRTAEAQAEIVEHLNEIVRASLSLPADELERDCIFIPTGDGMCIAFINLELRYDIHIQTSLKILELLDTYNKSTSDETRKFQVKIGINQNTDILITDINSRTNVAGAGINLAARIMDKADGGQILVSQTVYEELQPSEKYMDKFQRFSAKDKHDKRFQVFQFVSDEYAGLNIDTPSEFKEKDAEKESEPKLDEHAAHYLAQAIRHRSKIFELKDQISHIDIKATILYWMLAYNALSSGVKKLASNEPTWMVARQPFDEQLKYIDEINFRVILVFFFLVRERLIKYDYYFEEASLYEAYLFPNEMAAPNLEKQWPSIWTQFSLDEIQDPQSEG